MSQVSQRSLRLLVVEDNAMILETLKLALEMEGFVVYEASDGHAALDALERLPLPNLILLDLLMPGMNGRDFLVQIKKDTNNPIAKIPIIVISAVADKAKDVSNLVQGVIPKPILLDTLFSEIERFCPKWS